jgi:hypothetical protein
VRDDVARNRPVSALIVQHESAKKVKL